MAGYPPAMKFARYGLAIGVASLGILARQACAQQTEYRIDEPGKYVETQAPIPGSDEAKIAEARQLLADNKPGLAYDIVNEFIEFNDRKENAWLPAAYLARADAQTADGNEYKALFDYETLIIRYPGSPEFIKALERELDIGVRYLAGMKRRLWGMRIADASSTGEELLVRVQERLPHSALAEQAALELADYYYRERDLNAASEMYEIFLANYPRSQHRQRAMERRIYTNIARFSGPAYEANGLVEARKLLEEYVDRYPAQAARNGLGAALDARLEESLGAQLLDRARWYLRRDDPVSARFTFRKLARLYPATLAASEARRELQERGWEAPASQAPPVADGASVPEPASETKGKEILTDEEKTGKDPEPKEAPPEVQPGESPERPR